MHLVRKLMGRAGIPMNAEGGDGSSNGGGSGGSGAPQITPEIQALIDQQVSGLKAKNQELLGSLAQQKETLKKFEGIDPDKTRELFKRMENDEESRLIAEGKLDEVLKKRTERMKNAYEQEAAAERNARQAAEKRAQAFADRVLENEIRAVASSAGIHPHAVEDALFRARTVFELSDDGKAVAMENQFGKDGNPLTPAEWFGDMKTKAPHWFPAQGSGGGAQQSKAGTGASDKTITRAQFDAMSPTERTQAMRSKIQVVD